MRASRLKEMYPDFWEEMDTAIKEDFRLYADLEDVDEGMVDIIAHNAAFNACSSLHKYLKERTKCDGVTS
jgi:hypothetical protein